MGTVVQLSRKDARQAAKLLRELQIHLESAIETSIAPGGTEAFEEIDAPHVATDRAMFKSAERLIRRIDVALGDRQRNRRFSRKRTPDGQKKKLPGFNKGEVYGE
jgi:hypothetical protein